MGHRDIFCACLCVCLFACKMAVLVLHLLLTKGVMNSYCTMQKLVSVPHGLKPRTTNRKRVISPLNHLGSSGELWNLEFI
jgi:hypothetical protein